MIRAFVTNPRLIALTIALLLVSGMGAFQTLPRTEDPQITNRVGIFITPFPGASAERVEALVSEPLEQSLREISEIKNIFSSSKPGLSAVTLELKDDIMDADPVWSRARDLVSGVHLPEGTLQTQFDDQRGGKTYTLLISLTESREGGASLASLSRYAKELKSQLSAMPGTKLVKVFGEPVEEVLVEVDPVQLAALSLSLPDVAQALSAADAKLSAGAAYGKQLQYGFEVAGEFDSLERIRQVPMRTGADRQVRVGDIAKIVRQNRQPPAEIAVVKDQRALVVAVQMLSDQRVDRYTEKVHKVLDQYRQQVPGGIQVDVIFEQDFYTQKRLGELATNLLIGFAIIVSVLLVTLGFRSAIVVALALPLTTLFTLFCMQLTNLPIHQISVTGLVVALGIMVDNAIVMVEGIQSRRLNGMTALEAVLDAVGHFWLPLLGSTLTTILAFAPIVMMPGPSGEFVGGIGWSVIFALIGSYWISHTIIAGLAGRMMRGTISVEGGWYRNGIRLPKLSAAFQKLLHLALRWPLLTILLVGCFPISGFWAAGQLTEQFFPPSDRDMFNIEVRLSSAASIEGTHTLVRDISKELKAFDGIKEVDWFLGNSAPPFYYNLLELKDGEPNFAQAMVKTDNFKVANRLIPELQWFLDDRFPQAQIMVRKLDQGPPFNAPIEVRIYGPSIQQLKALGDQVRHILVGTEHVMHTRSTMSAAQPKLIFVADETLANQAALPLNALARQMFGALEGITGGSLIEGSEELPVRVRLAALQRQDWASIEQTLFTPPVAMGSTLPIPMTALGHLTMQPAPSEIPRRNGSRINVVEGYLRADILPQTVLNEFQARLTAADFHLPPGYRMEYGGESGERDNAVGSLLASVGIILTALLAVIVLSFNSFRLSGVIVLVAIQSAALGLLCVYFAGYPFGFTVIIALMGLMGLAINAAIVILAELKGDPESAAGDKDAVVHGVMSCSRHIVSTTITTVGGFMPLILEGGGFWPSFAIAIAGGTLLTTMISLLFVPAIFLLLSRRRGFDSMAVTVKA